MIQQRLERASSTTSLVLPAKRFTHPGGGRPAASAAVRTLPFVAAAAAL